DDPAQVPQARRRRRRRPPRAREVVKIRDAFSDSIAGGANQRATIRSTPRGLKLVNRQRSHARSPAFGEERDARVAGVGIRQEAVRQRYAAIGPVLGKQVIFALKNTTPFGSFIHTLSGVK